MCWILSCVCYDKSRIEGPRIRTYGRLIGTGSVHMRPASKEQDITPPFLITNGWIKLSLYSTSNKETTSSSSSYLKKAGAFVLTGWGGARFRMAKRMLKRALKDPNASDRPEDEEWIDYDNLSLSDLGEEDYEKKEDEAKKQFKFEKQHGLIDVRKLSGIDA